MNSAQDLIAPAPDLPRAVRKGLSQRSAYVLAATVIGLSLFASGVPSPVYGLYGSAWGISTAVLTLVYATYAFGVLAALLLAGRISDEVGRRPVLLTALGGIAAATVLYMLASSVAWLFVARGLQGLATGLALAAASAALIDLHPRRDPVGVGLANGVASAGGMALGILASSTIVQLLPDPRVSPYVLLAVLVAPATLATSRLRDPVPRTPGARLRFTPQRPSVPRPTRRAFLLAGLAVLSSWSINGLFLSLGPSLASQLLDTDSVLLTGLVVGALPAAAALSMVFFGRGAPWAGASIGSLVLAVGMALMVASVALASAALFVAATLLSGLGFGVAFLGGLRSLSAAIPDQHRAAVMSAFYLVAYGALSIPAIAAGFLTGPLGLEATFEVFGVAIAALALVVAAEAFRSRPRPVIR